MKRKLWREESMLEAVKSIEDDGKGLREAARIYNVPDETLRRRVVGITSVDAKPGRDTILTSEEERRLAQYIIDMCDMGFGLSRQDVIRDFQPKLNFWNCLWLNNWQYSVIFTDHFGENFSSIACSYLEI